MARIIKAVGSVRVSIVLIGVALALLLTRHDVAGIWVAVAGLATALLEGQSK